MPGKADTSTATLITQMLLAVGGFGGLAAAIRAVFSWRKTAAEAGGVNANAVQVISAAAASLVAPLEGRIVAMEQEMAGFRGREAEYERREREAERHARELMDKLREFEIWCTLASRTLAQHGIQIEPPPKYEPSGGMKWPQ